MNIMFYKCKIHRKFIVNAFLMSFSNTLYFCFYLYSISVSAAATTAAVQLLVTAVVAAHTTVTASTDNSAAATAAAVAVCVSRKCQTLYSAMSSSAVVFSSYISFIFCFCFRGCCYRTLRRYTRQPRCNTPVPRGDGSGGGGGCGRVCVVYTHD